MARPDEHDHESGDNAAESATGEEGLSPPKIAEALLDLCDLAIRHLLRDERGRTTLAEKDDSVLQTVVARLAAHRHAYAAPEVGRKVQTLTPEMKSLGWLRLMFNDLCGFAAQRKATLERDGILSHSLAEACVKVGRLEIRPEHVERAVDEVRRLGNSNYERLQQKEDVSDLSSDWLRNALPNDERQSPSMAAGKILSVAITESGGSMPNSGSSTAEYSQRVVLDLKPSVARKVSPQERLTFLVTVLGAPREVAPWVAYQVNTVLAVEGESPRGSFAFRAYDEQEQTTLIAAKTEALLTLEPSDSQHAASRALGPFFPQRTPWAGSEIEPLTERLLVEDPWNPVSRVTVPVKVPRVSSQPRQRKQPTQETRDSEPAPQNVADEQQPQVDRDDE